VINRHSDRISALAEKDPVELLEPVLFAPELKIIFFEAMG
jgi:hypothetical protein